MHQFVTGAAGFIGTHYCAHVAQQGGVHGIDNFDDYYPAELKRCNAAYLAATWDVQVDELDIRGTAALTARLKQERPDVVVHLAARPGVRGSIQDPRAYFDVNVQGTLSVLEAGRNAGVPHVVLASSSSVYGRRSGHGAFVEGVTPADSPASPYALSKRTMEMLGGLFHSLYGTHVTCLRLFTAYGPRQRPEMAIAKFVRAALEDRPIEMYGDGRSSRDYTYISDIVAGIAAAAAHPGGFRVFNLGGQSPVLLHELIALIGKQTGRAHPLEVRRMPPQLGDVEVTWADCAKAKDVLGWVPTVPLEEGLRRTVEWARAEYPAAVA